jgi:hypothetical protein
MEIEDLILKGALEPAGIDPDSGEMLYTFTEKINEVHPVLAKEMQNMFDTHMMKLWELDMIKMNVMEKNPIVKLSKNAFNQKLIDSLDEEVAYTLKEIKRRFITELYNGPW